MDRLSGATGEGPGPGSGEGEGAELPVLADAASGVGTARRWAADPLPLLVLIGAAGLAVAALALLGALTGAAAWVVPALFGVVVAGVALSGST